MLVERSEENDPYINISHRALPSKEEHEAFVESKPFYIWNLIKANNVWLGYVSVTWRNEIGIILFIKHRNKGYGKEALKGILMEKPLNAIKSKRPGHFVANINPLNDKSIRLFEGLGFSHCQNTYELTNVSNT